MIVPVLRRLLMSRELSSDEARETLDALVSPHATDPERVALLVALSSRTTTPRELARFALELKRRAVPFRVPTRDRPVDLCGSGGARTPSFNVSTVSAFVVAGAGVPVVKHGNRSARGPCGSTDLLEALGLPVAESLPFARATYRATRLAFLHAPLYHPTTRAVMPARRIVGIPTVFNALGPLSNPAPIAYQVVGVGDPATAERTATVLRYLHRRRGMAVTSVEGADEFSPQRTTRCYVSTGARIYPQAVVASDYLSSDERKGEWGALPPLEAAEEARRILAGGGGARRGSVLLTSGAALWVAGTARDMAQGVARAREALDSGRAEAILEKLEQLAVRFRPRAEG